MDNGLIGVWWYTDAKDIWARFLPRELGEYDRDHIVFSKTLSHRDIWKDIVEENTDDPEELIREGHDIIEYGSVEYNILTQRYEIICSGDLYDDAEFKKEILKYFRLEHARIEFVLRVD